MLPAKSSTTTEEFPCPPETKTCWPTGSTTIHELLPVNGSAVAATVVCDADAAPDETATRHAARTPKRRMLTPEPRRRPLEAAAQRMRRTIPPPLLRFHERAELLELLAAELVELALASSARRQ